MVAVQEISARIGRTTGKGIADNIREHYPGWLLQPIVLLLLIANTVNIAADLGAMGNAAALLAGERIHPITRRFQKSFRRVSRTGTDVGGESLNKGDARFLSSSLVLAG
jgi:hypothetical protein